MVSIETMLGLGDYEGRKSDRQFDHGPFDEKLVRIVQGMQFIMKHFPGGDNELGSSEYNLASFHISLHNTKFKNQPENQVNSDVDNLGKLVNDMWKSIVNSKVDITYEDIKTHRNKMLVHDDPESNTVVFLCEFGGLKILKDINVNSTHGITFIFPENYAKSSSVDVDMLSIISGFALLADKIQKAINGKFSKEVEEFSLKQGFSDGVSSKVILIAFSAFHNFCNLKEPESFFQLSQFTRVLLHYLEGQKYNLN